MKYVSTLSKIRNLMTEGKFDKSLSILSQTDFKDTEYKIEALIYKAKIFGYKGEFSKSLSIANKILEETENHNLFIYRLGGTIVKISALWRLGKIDQALDMIEKGEILLNQIDECTPKFKLWKGELYHLSGNVSLYQGDLDRALSYYQDSLVIRKELNKQKQIADTLNNIGVIKYHRGDLDETLKYYLESLEIRRKLGNKYDIATSLNNMGTVFYNKGELENALDYYLESLETYREIGNNQSVAEALNNIGGVYKDKGQLEKALEYHQKSLSIKKEIGNKQEIARSLRNIGIISFKQTQYKEALDYHYRSLDLIEETGNELEIVLSLAEIIRTLLKIDKRKEAKFYLDKLEQINAKYENEKIELYYNFCIGIYYKDNERLKDKVKAQNHFEKITNSDLIEHSLMILSSLYLTELLLDELRLYGKEEVLNEVRSLSNRIYSTGQDQNSLPLIVESLILNTKLSLIVGEIDKASIYLDQAMITVQERELDHLYDKVKREQEEFEDQIHEWDEMIEKSASYRERIEKAQINEYIDHLKQNLSPN